MYGTERKDGVYRIGTRGSALALAQAGNFRDVLASHFPEYKFELTVISTVGDRDHSAPLSAIGSRGVFVQEIEEALINGTIDMAVHSLKDMPAEIPDALTLAPFIKREDPRDVLILREGISMQSGLTIATGSLRRKVQLPALIPDVHVIGLRGNIDTRLRKLNEGCADGIILARAGLRRLDLSPKMRIFSPDEMIPAAGQGALAAEVRKDRTELIDMISMCADPETNTAVTAERHFLELMGGGCFLPVGAYCEQTGNSWRLRCIFGNAEGTHIAKADITDTDPIKAVEAAVDNITQEMRKKHE